MENPTEFERLWGDEIIKFDHSQLASLDIPDSAKSFLDIGGLPKRVLLLNGLVFRAFEKLQRYEIACRPSDSMEIVTLIGSLDDDVGYLAIHSGGDVVMFFPMTRDVIFINSSIDAFAWSLYVFKSLSDRSPIDSLKSQLSSVDANALSRDENYWSLVIEDVESLK